MNILENKEQNTSKNLENSILSINVQNNLEDIDKKSEKLLKLIKDFVSEVPPMVQKIQVINEKLKLKEFNDTISGIKESSKNIEKISNDIIAFNKNLVKESHDKYIANLNSISNKAKESVSSVKHSSKILVAASIIFMLMTIIMNIIYLRSHERKIENINYHIYSINEILEQNQKYWIDKDNYIRYKEVKNNQK